MNVRIEESALAEFAIDALKQIITAGFANAGGPNERRLQTTFAKGYVFGFVYALIQEHGVKEDTNGGRLMTDVCVEIYGPVVGPAILDRALVEEPLESVFTQGQIAGSRDMLRWLADLEAVPVLLVDYLAGRA